MKASNIEKQLDRIEHAHRFTRAVSVGNPREFLQAEKEDQEMAEACKRLIKNCIVCWNYLYHGQSSAAVGVQGMGGIGKTMLASALAHDPKVRNLTGSEQASLTTKQEGKDALREALEGRRILVILDDV